MCSKKLPLLVLLIVSVLQLSAQNLHEQLCKLNRHWAGPIAPKLENQQTSTRLGEVELIQTHLRLVIQQLEKSTPANLDAQKLAARKTCLDSLTTYADRGVFPKNLYHKERTPYFIDDFGTACAVGQMIVTSGHADLAQAISKCYNYEYIENIPVPEMITWADNHGFAVNELQWIQPTYGNGCPWCPTDSFSNPTCATSNYGCIGRISNISLTNPPFSYQWYQNFGPGWWAPISDYTCDLYSGYYKCFIRDSQGDIEERLFTLTGPSPWIVAMSPNQPRQGCDGSVAFQVNGATPPYYSDSLRQHLFPSLIDSLCFGTYSFRIFDSNGCNITLDVTLEAPSGIDEQTNLDFNISPNPSSGQLTLNMSKPAEEEVEISIFNMTGQLVRSLKTMEQQMDIDISNQQEGMYLVSISGQSSSGWRKISKHSR